MSSLTLCGAAVVCGPPPDAGLQINWERNGYGVSGGGRSGERDISAV